MDLAALKQELTGMEFIHGLETVRDINEGKFHHGTGAVVQVIAVRPEMAN